MWPLVPTTWILSRSFSSPGYSLVDIRILTLYVRPRPSSSSSSHEQGPFRYKALPPDEISFVPLTETEGRVFKGKELMEFYRETPSAKHLKPYTDIIYDSPVYPVIYDSAGTVLSLPPIINGRHSRIQMHTTNVFIECTGTDLTKANIVLDTVVTMFSQYCAEPFTAEEVCT